MQVLEINAASEKDAVKAGADLLLCEQDHLEAKLVKKGSGGFLGLGSKNPSIYSIFALKNKTPGEAVMRGVLHMLTAKMGYIISIVDIETREDGKTYIVMESEKAGHIIGKKGKTLEAIQFMVNLMVQNYTGEPPKILLDIENYRDRRAKYLTDISAKLAFAVKKTRKSKLLEPLNPYERRIVHMALQDDDKVETESEGIGVYKRVRIKLKNSDRKKESTPDLQKDEEELTRSILNGDDFSEEQDLTEDTEIPDIPENSE